MWYFIYIIIGYVLASIIFSDIKHDNTFECVIISIFPLIWFPFYLLITTLIIAACILYANYVFIEFLHCNLKKIRKIRLTVNDS